MLIVQLYTEGTVERREALEALGASGGTPDSESNPVSRSDSPVEESWRGIGGKII
jgi:hypothetical protein